jgi:oxygen-independent coproporphyrinogen-3 oxidase
MRHVYVHVPFCRRRCSYCDFSIAVRRRVPSDAYADALAREYAMRRDSPDWSDAPLTTLYLGGGTPSLLAAGTLARVVTLLAPNPGSAAEVTIEANPEDVTPDHAAAWARCGVNRVSLGVQSLTPHVLEWMHRPHGPAAPAAAVKALRGAGIRSISVDLIFAVPDDLQRDLADDVERLLVLEPDHVSAYGLTVEARTPLARWVSRGATRPPDDSRYADEFLAIDERLTRAGFEHYEVSNYARPGHHSRHNSAYWSGAQYAGLGPAAHRFDGATRSWNVPTWTAYARLIGAGSDPTAEREALTNEQQALERLYLGLRTSDGVEVVAIPPGRAHLTKKMETQGWLTASALGLRLTALGWLRLDEIVSVLTT